MKKLAFLVAAISCSVAANAQAVYGYQATINAGTYEELTDATVVAKGTDENIKTIYDGDGEIISSMASKAVYPSGVKGTYTDDSDNEITTFTEAGFPLGFDFYLAGTPYNSFVIGTNGIIYLGNETITCTPEDGRYSFNRANNDNFVSCIPWNDVIAVDDTEISYKIIGEEPNRTLVVQYKNWAWKTSMWDDTSVTLDMQIRLNEGTNSIDFVFNNTAAMEDPINTRLGIKAGEAVTINGYPADYSLERSNSESFSVANDLVNGTTVTFSAPSACVAPTTQPAELVLSSTTTEISGTFTATDAELYLITYTVGNATGSLPVDKITYEEGDKIGDTNVLAFTTDTVFTLIDCLPATKYTFKVYAANAYGLNGPAYNTVEPLTAEVYSRPEAPAALTVGNATYDSVDISATTNEAGNNILIAYTTELVRDSYGDYPAVGNLSGEYKAGDELTLAITDWNDEVTEYKSTVAYFGPAIDKFTLTGLNHSTGYYFVAFSYDETCGYSSVKAEANAATIGKLPYSANFASGKNRFIDGETGLPPGWTESEPEKGMIGVDANSKVSSEETDGWILQMYGMSNSGNAETGLEFSATLPAIFIDKRAAAVSFEYSWFIAQTRFATTPYSEWVDGDKIAIQVSTDGSTFEDLAYYDSASRPEVTEMTQFSKLEGDLSKYEGQIVYLRIYWKTFAYDYWKQPGTLVIKNLTIDGREIPATPEVLVKNITHTSARLQWRGMQTAYEVAFGKAGEEPAIQVIEGVAEVSNTLELTDLTAETAYEVKVRGIAGENDYSNWSETVTFTTAAWPECQKPSNLQANLDMFVTDGIVNLSWEGNDEHLSWEIRYRESTSTSYSYVSELTETATTLTGLNHSTAYLWSVRAECIADRITAWSSQGSFETPVIDGINEVVADGISVNAVSGNISIINGKIYVENVVVFDANGHIIANVDVDGYDNVIIPVNRPGVAIVMVNTADKTFSYKVLIK